MGTNGPKGQKAKGKGRDIGGGLDGFFDVKPHLRRPVPEFLSIHENIFVG
jgi:hypothetical protein